MLNPLRPCRKILKAFFDDYAWVHITLGIIGNLIFFSGSLLLLLREELRHISIGLFVIGSFLMLIGTIGDALVHYAYQRRNKEKKTNK